MFEDQSNSLRVSKKLEIIYHLLNGEPISHLIDDMKNHEVIDTQKFMWEKTVEFGVKSRGKNFARDEVTRYMTPSDQYQKLKNCKEPKYYCKGTLCINNHQECARNKIKEHIDIMADAIRQFIDQNVEEIA
ncbi:MAG: hypothetical protein V2J62_05250 [candidate division KSB1 bacterium]|jgi:hypothetical protein|nr:hypothetical protein [candidate division KSB1 bacterium]